MVQFVACLLQQVNHTFLRPLPLLPLNHDLVLKLALAVSQSRKHLFLLLLPYILLLGQSLLNQSELITDLPLQGLFKRFSLRDARLERVIQHWDLILEVVAEALHDDFAAVTLSSDFIMELLRAVLDQLSELIVDALLDRDLLSDAVSDSRLQFVKLSSFSFEHLLVLAAL